MRAAAAVAAWWLTVRLGPAFMEDSARRHEERASHRGVARGAALGRTPGQRLEALGWLAVRQQWGQLVRRAAPERRAG